MVYQLIYTSKLRSGMGEKTIKKIAVQSRERNIEHGVTGVLIFANGMVLQVLEGEKHIVDQLYRQVTRDTRHHEVVTVIESEAAARAFEDIPLALKIITDAKKVSQLKALARSAENMSMSA